MARLNWDRERRRRPGSQEVFTSNPSEVDNAELPPAHVEARLRYQEGLKRAKEQNRRKQERKQRQKNARTTKKADADSGSRRQKSKKRKNKKATQGGKKSKGTPSSGATPGNGNEGSRNAQRSNARSGSRGSTERAESGQDPIKVAREPPGVTAVRAWGLPTGTVIALPVGGGRAQVTQVRHGAQAVDQSLELGVEPVEDARSIEEATSLVLAADERVVVVRGPREAGGR